MAKREYSVLTRGQVAKRLGIRVSGVRELKDWLPEVPGLGVYRRCDFERLPTRRLVGRLLGKSQATVRALEAEGLLHPAEVAGGLRIFNPEEVEPLVGKSFGRQAQTRWFRRLLEERADAKRHAKPSRADNTAVVLLRAQLAEALEENGQLRSIIAQFEEFGWTC